MYNRISITDSKLTEMYKSGATGQDLAIHCGVSDTAIYQRLKKLGVERRLNKDFHIGGPRGPEHHLWKGGRSKRGNYIAVYSPGHHRAMAGGYVYEHVLIAERALGRPLDSKHPVHHFNENKTDNANTNLVICESHAYHKHLHVRQRVRSHGGNPDTDKWCWKCNRTLPRETNFYSDANAYDGLRSRCKECSNAAQKRYVAKKRG